MNKYNILREGAKPLWTFRENVKWLTPYIASGFGIFPTLDSI